MEVVYKILSRKGVRVNTIYLGNRSTLSPSKGLTFKGGKVERGEDLGVDVNGLRFVFATSENFSVEVLISLIFLESQSLKRFLHGHLMIQEDSDSIDS